MSRLYCFAGVALAIVLALGTVACGGEPNPRPKAPLNRPAQPGSTVAQPGAVYNLVGTYGLPAYAMLQTEYVQKELELTPEQKEKLKEIATKAMEPPKDEPQIDWAKFRELKPEEQQKIQKERTERYLKRAEETKKQIEQVLTPKQLDQIKDIEYRQRAAMMLAMPHVVQQIGLSDDQQQQMQKVREEMQSKMMQIQHESQEKTLGVLNAEQTKKLKELSEKGMSGWGELRERAPRPKEK